MKIAVSSSGNDLSSSVDPHFGRCPRFIIVETETMEFEIVPTQLWGQPMAPVSQPPSS